MTDFSMSSSDVSLSDSIYSNSALDNEKIGKEVIDMSRFRDKSMTKTVIRRGRGWSTPMNGTEVTIHFVAKREDESVFDSSRDRNQVLTFTVGRKQVIKGLDIAIKTMKWSEISKFTFSGEYSFSETDCPQGLTPKELVTYEVELFYFKLIDLTKTKDGRLVKRIITPGVGYDLAVFGSKCEVEFIGKYNDNVFEERSVSFIVGEAAEEGVIDGIEIAVTKMRAQEKCQLFVKPDYAFGPKGKPEFGIPEDYTQVVYELTLNSFTEEKEPFELTDTQKLETSEAMKTKANKYFNENKYRLSCNQYKRMVKVLRHDSTKDFGTDFRSESDIDRKEFESKIDKLLFISYQNVSICYQKLQEFSESLQWIEMALKLDSQNAKALHIRGKAYHSLHEYALARDDFKKSLELDPNNKSSHNFIIICENAIKSEAESERKMFEKLFKPEDKTIEESLPLNDSGDDQDIKQSGSQKDV